MITVYHVISPICLLPHGIIFDFVWSINSNEVRSLITMQRAGKGKALPSAFLTLNDAARQQVWKEGHVVNGSFNIVVRSAPLRYRRKWIAIPPAVAQLCVLHFLVCTTSRRHKHAGNVSKKKWRRLKASSDRWFFRFFCDRDYNVNYKYLFCQINKIYLCN